MTIVACKKIRQTVKFNFDHVPTVYRHIGMTEVRTNKFYFHLPFHVGHISKKNTKGIVIYVRK